MRNLAVAAFALFAAAVAEAETPAPRIVTLGGAVTEIVAALGGGNALVAVDDSSSFPATVKALPKVGYYRSISAEGVLSLRPSLVFASAASGPPAAIDQLRAAGVTVVVVPEALTLAAAKERIVFVAKSLGREADAKALVAAIDASIAALAPAKGRRVLFLHGHGRAVQASGRDTAADAMLRIVGATNVIDGYTGYKPLVAEALVAAQPEVVLTTTAALAAAGGAEGVWSQPGFAATPAGRARRLVVLDDLYLLGFGPRVGAAAAELAQALR